MKKIVTVLLMLWSIMAHANSSPIKVVVPYAPGGGADVLFRVMQKYADTKNIVIFPEYKAGAAGQIGITHFTKAEADGKTIMLTINSDVSRATELTRSKLYPVSALTDNEFVLVSSAQGSIKTLGQLTAKLVAAPEKLNWGAGSAVLDRLARLISNELLKSKVAITLIPYSGAGKVIPDLVSGQLDVAVMPKSLVNTLVDNGMLIQLAVWNNSTPSETCYNLPKILDGNLVVDGYGIFLPAAAPENIKRFWIEFSEEFTRNEQYRKILHNRNMVILQAGPDNLRNIINRNL